MPGAYGWAAEKGLAYSFGKPFSQQKFPDLVQWVQEAEIKHARVAMLTALGYPVAEVFHPLWGGSINEPSLIAFQATPLQTFWPIGDPTKAFDRRALWANTTVIKCRAGLTI